MTAETNYRYDSDNRVLIVNDRSGPLRPLVRALRAEIEAETVGADSYRREVVATNCVERWAYHSTRNLQEIQVFLQALVDADDFFADFIDIDTFSPVWDHDEVFLQRFFPGVEF